MGEVIQFPAPNETRGDIFTVCNEEGEEICHVHSVTGARNIARIMSEEWPGRSFIVFDDADREMFRVSQGEKSSA